MKVIFIYNVEPLYLLCAVCENLVVFIKFGGVDEFTDSLVQTLTEFAPKAGKKNHIVTSMKVKNINISCGVYTYLFKRKYQQNKTLFYLPV